MTLIQGCRIPYAEDVHRARQAMEQAQMRVRETIDRLIFEIRQSGSEVGSD